MSYWKSCLLLLAGLLITVNAHADERILSFHSDIKVYSNGSLQVTETIRVRAEGKEIKRGIYRDLPTSYPHPRFGWLGLQTKTPMGFQSVTRDGRPESYHKTVLKNGVRYYLGDKDVYLKNGQYTYTLKYRAERQIAWQDEQQATLYWNVTGNGWSFPIDKASAKVTFVDNAAYHGYEAWTGVQGSTESDVSFDFPSSNVLTVAANRGLGAQEGLTLRVRFNPTGPQVSVESEWSKLYKDNRQTIWGLVLLAIMSAFYLVVWLVSGIDPKKGIIVARYRPLENYSAAAHRSLFFNRADDTSFAVGILSAAVKGWLSIEKQSGRAFRLQKIETTDAKPLSTSEQILVDGLFARRSVRILGNKYSESVAAVRKEYNQYLMNRFAKLAHKTHQYSLAIGLLIGVIGLVMIVLALAKGSDDDTYVFAVVAGFFVSRAGLSPFSVNDKWAYSFAITGIVVAVFAYILGDVLVVWSSSAFAIIVLLSIYLLPAPKKASRGLLDQIEGFRLYLAKAEHDSLKRLDLPTKTPQLYEELLPFALALDLETEWSDQFVDVLNEADKNDANTSRSLAWYHGSGSAHSASLAPALAASLAASVAAAATPPSSSSSGGGSSGGGGGGGGGGGW